MCQKQCRDSNGFKCHCATEGHLRMMELFRENSYDIIGNFSSSVKISLIQLENQFLQLLKLKYRDNFTPANEVYKEYINDKSHVHMNATRWDSLTAFIQYLAKAGRVEYQKSEKGDLIKYIDRDPTKLKKIEELNDREQIEREEAERQKKKLEKERKRLIESHEK